MKTVFFATMVASATAFAPVQQQRDSTSLNMAGYQDRFFDPKPTGGMNQKTMGWKMPETIERGPSTQEEKTVIPPYGTDHQNNAQGGHKPLGYDWTIGKTTVERGPAGHGQDATPIQPYGQEHQANAKGGKGPIGFDWTIGKTTALREPTQKSKPTLKPYGEIHQANGQGGKGPLGKEWTTKMDQTYEQGQERFHPFK